MKFKIFGYTVTIQKESDPEYYWIDDNITYMTYAYAEKTVLKKLGYLFSREEVLEDRIPAIKKLRDIVKADYGYPLGLRQAKEFVEEYFDYYGKRE